mgnify:CR=1 FL=1
MNIDIKIILFTILELVIMSLVSFIGIWAINLSLIVCLIELQFCEETY